MENGNKPLLRLDFADALGVQKKNDNFLHNILARHYDVQIVDTPDVLIFTHYGHRNRLYSCKKIYYSQERYAPDWNQCDAAVSSSYVDHPHAYWFPYFAAHRKGKDLVRPTIFDWDRVLDEKRGFCSYLHKYADRSVANRTHFFHELNRRKKVDSGGRAMNNMGFEIPGTAGRAKMEFLAKYRFHIAFENRLAPGWTTEKFTDPFEVYSIPIYWGDSRALQWFNPKAFVNVSDFRNFSECCDYILHLENSREDYARMLMEPPFKNNRAPEIYDDQKLLEFLVREIERPGIPAARRRWFWPFTRWRLVKRDRIHGE